MIGRLHSWGTAWKRISLILGLFVAAAPASAFATTYYVDFATGQDANTGTSKSAPWAHAPGMAGCSGTCNSVALRAGDSVIFKGGVTWNQTSFPFNIGSSGSTTNPIYFGVDPTWFTGASFTQPIFDAGNTIPSGGSMVVFGASTQGVTFDNLEVRNMRIDNSGGALDHCLIQFMYGATNITVKNALVHTWSVTTAGKYDQMGGICGLGPMTGTVLDHSTVFDDDATSNKVSACTFNIETVSFSTIHDCVEGVFGGKTAHDNLIYNIYQSTDSTAHENALQVNASGDMAVYNNVIHDVLHGTCLYALPVSSGTTRIYNNVIWNTVITPINIDPENLASSAHNIQVFNNTAVPGGSGTTFRVTPRPVAAINTVTLENNLWITDATAPLDIPAGSVATLLNQSNTLLTNATATSQGFVISNQFAPASATTSAKGAGLNLSSLGIIPLNSDIKGLARPAMPTAWDAGGYQFGGTPRPAPSSGLVAVVQ